MESGFGGASMDAIAAAGGVSKATVYAYFKSKEELFSQVVAQQGDAHALTLGSPRAMPTAILLDRIARDLAALILSADTAAMYRIVMSEAGNVPDLGRRFYEAGPTTLLAALADCLSAAMARGDLAPAPTHVAAAQFIGLILGDLQLRLLLHVGAPPGARLRNAVARQGVAAFLRAYAPH